MKIRHGFVSNSSSSSFVCAIDDEQVPLGFDLRINIERYTEELISTEDELKEYIMERYDEGHKNRKTGQYEFCETYDEYAEKYPKGRAVKMYNEWVKKLEDGKKIAVVWASYNQTDDPVELLLGNSSVEVLRNLGLDVLAGSW